MRLSDRCFGSDRPVPRRIAEGPLLDAFLPYRDRPGTAATGRTDAFLACFRDDCFWRNTASSTPRRECLESADAVRKRNYLRQWGRGLEARWDLPAVRLSYVEGPQAWKALMVPNGCSAVWRRMRMVLGATIR